jgi:hypothetical protein
MSFKYSFFLFLAVNTPTDDLENGSVTNQHNSFLNLAEIVKTNFNETKTNDEGSIKPEDNQKENFCSICAYPKSDDNNPTSDDQLGKK